MPARLAVRMWARSELRRRWRSLVVLGVIAGIVGGLAMAAVAGARRTATAYARFNRATAAPHAILFGTQIGLEDGLDYSQVVRLPEVTAWGLFNLAPVFLKGYDQLGTLAPGPSGGLYSSLSRPLIRAGRPLNTHRADEVVVNEDAARKFHLHVGQRVTVASSTDLNA